MEIINIGKGNKGNHDIFYLDKNLNNKNTKSINNDLHSGPDSI